MNLDFTGLFDLFGEPVTVALCGLAIGAVFGFAAQRSRFCLRAAILEFFRGRLGEKVAVWVLSFSMAVFGTQVLISTQLLDVAEARQLSSQGSVSGALLGGLLFGIGMVLARGCASRLLVLSANGNLRALLSGLVFAVTAQASLHGGLAPLRDRLAGLWVIGEPSSLSAVSLLNLPPAAPIAFGTLFMVGALAIALRARLDWVRTAGALGVGAMIAAGWLITYSLSLQAFDPVQVESLTFTGPSADTLMLVLDTSEIDFDVGLVPGVFLGSFLAAALARELKVEGFTSGASMWRYIFGAVFMGFGGMLAGGCAVGAGVTGGAVFATVSWVALTAMWTGAALTDLIVDRRRLLAGSATASPLHP